MNVDDEKLKALVDLVNEQSEDDALWCIADRISEAYLQQELRKLHTSIEDAFPERFAV